MRFFYTVKGGGSWRSDPCWDRGPEEAGTQADVRRTRTPLSGLEPQAKAGKIVYCMMESWALWSRELIWPHWSCGGAFLYLRSVSERDASRLCLMKNKCLILPEEQGYPRWAQLFSEHQKSFIPQNKYEYEMSNHGQIIMRYICKFFNALPTVSGFTFDTV